MVKLSEVEPFSGMLAAPNALMITGGATTAMPAFEVLPVPPSADVTSTLLFCIPAVIPVTFTVIVQVEPAAGDAVIVPPDRLTLPLPATAVIVPLPQEPVKPFGVATCRPAGRLSVNATPLSATLVFGLLLTNVSVVLVFLGMLAAPQFLVMVGVDTTP